MTRPAETSPRPSRPRSRRRSARRGSRANEHEGALRYPMTVCAVAGTRKRRRAPGGNGTRRRRLVLLAAVLLLRGEDLARQFARAAGEDVAQGAAAVGDLLRRPHAEDALAVLDLPVLAGRAEQVTDRAGHGASQGSTSV